MKKVLKSVSICFIITAMLTAGAFAAAPIDPVQPQASKYISETSTAGGALGSGKVRFDFTITATDIMKDVGALRVNIYEVGVTAPVWSHHYTDPGYGYMMGHNTSSHVFGVTYSGQSGHQYYAKVQFFAGEHGVAGGICNMGSAIITAV